MLGRTSAFLCISGRRAVSVPSELQKILPTLLPLLDPPFTKGASVSAAHLILATGHTSKRNDVHMPDCPVLAHAVPLTAVADHVDFMRRPCLSCLKRRVHFLASEHFCMNLEEKCSKGGSGKVPADWEAIVAKKFGSTTRLMEEVVMYASCRREPGWTWLLYDRGRPEGHRLVVVNFPANRVPLELGFWPLAVINMTESSLLTAIEGDRTTATVEYPVAPWSRAARNPLAASTRGVEGMTGHVTDTTLVLDGDLSSIRTQVANSAVLNMNWDFVLQQWKQAEDYYTSAEREKKIRAQRKKLEREAAVEAMSRLRDSGTTILTSDTVEITVADGGASAEAKPQDKTACGPETDEVKKEGKEKVVEADKVNQDPKCTQLEDGTWQYAYQSGDVTLLRPDGTRIFKKSDLTTTVFSDGSTLYEYLNNTSILDRMDGVRVTTFADGTKKEEKYK